MGGGATIFGINRQVDTKNGTMEVRNNQRIYLRPITLILQNHANGHETTTKLCLYQGRGTKNHHKGNN